MPSTVRPIGLGYGTAHSQSEDPVPGTTAYVLHALRCAIIDGKGSEQTPRNALVSQRQRDTQRANQRSIATTSRTSVPHATEARRLRF